MLIRYKWYCCCIVTILLFGYVESLFCTASQIQSSSFINKETNSFDDVYNRTYRAIKKNNDQSELNIKKTEKRTISSESTRSESWSNAFNFKKVWGSTVDPRTGILSTWVKTGSMLSNLGHGPDINLEVSYNSNASANPDGLGTGWNWNLTHFNLKTHQLTTSFGQNFYLHKQPDGHWWPLYHKFHDIDVQGDISTHFIITYANGLRETLNHQGYEVRLEQQDGWSVYFSYESGTHLLQSVKDDEGHSIKLYRIKNYISVISEGNKGKPVVVLIKKNNNELHSITLPAFSHHNSHGIYFHYLQHLMNGVDYPTGLKTRIIYNCSYEMKFSVIAALSPHALCVAVKEIINPGFGQPIMVSRYHYGTTNINEHNYLGFNSGLNITVHSTKDRLFEVPANYTYTTEQDNGLIREIRTYNKYHLMTDEKQVSDRTGYTLSSVHYFFCRTDQSDGCTHTSFDDLPVFYSFPLKIVTRVWGDISETPAETTVTAEYDSQGRVIRQTDALGRVTLNRYCPLKGDAACPAVTKEWSFGTLTESTALYPTHTEENITPLFPVTTRNYYRREINHNRKGYISVLDHQIQQAGKQQLIMTNYYYNNPKNLLTYGLLKKSILTGYQNGTDFPDSVIQDYYYIKSVDNNTKTTYSAIELSESKRQISSYITTSLFTNQVLKVEDAEKKDSDIYCYDKWDRLIKTERAFGTPFAASIHYHYTISENLNQMLITTVNGLQKKILFDGTGKVLESFTEAIDREGKKQPDHWWPVEKTSYDKYGRIARHSSYIIDTFGHAKRLDITQDYDDTGRAVRVHLPDGGLTVIRYDDSDKCVISYQQNAQGEHSVLSVSRANILGKPVKQWVLPAIKEKLPSIKLLCLKSDKQPEARVSVITYDGFGRQITIQDPAGKIVRQYYDSMGRLTDTIGPAGNRMHRVYNLMGQVVQSWAYPVSGGSYLLSSSGYNRAGQLIWSAGEDGKHTVYTYTEDGQIATATIPSGHLFSWQYNHLNLPISESTDNQQQWTIDYDPVTLSLYKKTDITGITTYIYSDDGLIKHLTHTGKNHYPDYQLQWQYDSNRRLVNTTDISGNKTSTKYDWLGRIALINYYSYKKHHTETLFMPVYDGFSRIQHLDYGSSMYRTFHYDLWGNKDQIVDTQRGKSISEWIMTYDISSNIAMIRQKAKQKQYGILHYQYDVLDNLVSMYCQGSSGLPLCPHDTSLAGSKLTRAPVITRQNYTFTPLNRLTSVKETLQLTQHEKTLSKLTDYHYNDSFAPLRLQQISTSWNQRKSVVQKFSYDDMGNMTVDGQNNHISYNKMNEITQVISSVGKQSSYTYDGDGQKVMEKSPNGISYLFYRGGALINEKIISPGQDIHITGYLGVAKTIDGVISEYYESSYKGDIVGIFRKKASKQYQFSQRNIYSPYGMVWHKKAKTFPLYKQTLQGFDGERTDPFTGWQFLGNGNRTYNPEQHYFLSEDPAGDGYAFGSNNPIMNTDPSGNSPQWLGEIFKWTSYISTMGLSALHQRWANITASIIQAGCTVATLGATVASAGSAALAGVIAGTAAIGSIPVVAAAIPANKGFNIAGKIIGMAEMAVTVAAGMVGFLPFATAGEGAAEDFPLVQLPFKMLKARQETGIVLDDVSVATLDMPVQDYRQLSLSPAVSFSLSHILKASSSFFREGSLSYLNFTDEQSVIDALTLLRSSALKDHIGCDTSCILLMHQMVGKTLNIMSLDHFLSIRQKFSAGEALSPDHPYLKALKNILESIQGFQKGSRYNIGRYSFKTLKRIFFNKNYAMVSGYDHMAIMYKMEKGCARTVSPVWGVYQFSDNSIDIISVDKKGLHEKIFPNPYFNELVISGYMKINKFIEPL